MLIKPSNEFNAFGVVSQEMLLRLRALALSDSAAVASVFTAAADAAGLTERGRLALERRREQVATMIRTAMATQEQLAAFHQRLDRLERASYEALLESDERRRTARRELEQLRERAYQITMPDGRTVRVYRDGDTVREEGGTLVNPNVIRAEDIPAHLPTWQQREAKRQADVDAERLYGDDFEYWQRVTSVRDAARSGNVTAQELEQLEARAHEGVPSSVRLRLGEAVADAERRDFTPPGQGVLTPGPR